MVENKFAQIIKERQKQDIKWLRLSPGIQGDQGFFIYLYENISENYKYDYWFKNLDQAKEWAKERYDIDESDWKTVIELNRMGIMDIDM